MIKKIKKYIQHFILNDNGSTLITVIVAIAFVTILTSIILGTTVVNVRMKGIDRRTRDDFYYAERALNDIYTGLGQELAVKAGVRYDYAFKKIGETGELDSEGNPLDYNLAQTAEKEFRKSFLKDAYELVDGVTSDKLEAYITTLVATPTRSARNVVVERPGIAKYQKNDGSDADESNADRVVLEGVQLSDTDTSGYRAVITTDIVINVPTVDFLGTNADVSDYGIIANEGLYIEGKSEITGNVYAGVHETEESIDIDYEERTDQYSRSPVYGGINIKNGRATFDGNYIISKGDINLSGDNPQIEIYSPSGGDANLANLWASSIRTITYDESSHKGAKITKDPTEPSININANVFVLNDLALNADKSSAVLKGNYYGYNEGTIGNILGKKVGRFDGENSAIIINGSQAYLDMQNVRNFVLMGKAYIDFTSDKDTDATNTGTQVVPTAEGVALKTNQQLYLVPPDFLNNPNPAEGSGISFTIGQSTINPEPGKHWFGLKYLKYGSDINNPNLENEEGIHKRYEVKLTSGSTVSYDYLQFNDKAWKPVRENPSDPYSDIKKNPDGTYIYEETTDNIGTGGAISSKTKFFYDIMNSQNAYYTAYASGTDPDSVGKTRDQYIQYKESLLVQPSAYRLYKRIERSMDYDYFDLDKCVVGRTAHEEDVHYYAKNAVVNYERKPDPEDSSKEIIVSTVFNNTHGLGRYFDYTPHLYKRYMLLCTKLDGSEDVLIDGDPVPSKGIEADDWPDWKVTSLSPIKYKVDLAKIGSMDVGTSTGFANGKGLKTGAYGAVVVKSGSLDLGTLPDSARISSDKFKGVVIADGDIIVPNGMKVYGLLMSTGKIILRGNNEVTYDKGLIQSRIEKEINVVKGTDTSVAADPNDPLDYYLIDYLTKDDGTLLYSATPGSKIKRDRIEADYNDFMHYENWQKGENDATPTPTPTP